MTLTALYTQWHNDHSIGKLTSATHSYGLCNKSSQIIQQNLFTFVVSKTSQKKLVSSAAYLGYIFLAAHLVLRRSRVFYRSFRSTLALETEIISCYVRMWSTFTDKYWTWGHILLKQTSLSDSGLERIYYEFSSRHKLKFLCVDCLFYVIIFWVIASCVL